MRQAKRNLLKAAAAPPGRGFHLLLVVAIAGLFYAVSFPGIARRPLFASGLALFIIAVVWLFRTLIYMLGRNRREGSPLWFLVLPISALFVVMMLRAEVPLRLRWAASRGAFEHMVQTGGPPAATRYLPDGTERPWGFKGRVGLYEVTEIVSTVGFEYVRFYERTGSFLPGYSFSGDAGFLYVPPGSNPPHPAHWLKPISLGGGWYTWAYDNLT